MEHVEKHAPAARGPASVSTWRPAAVSTAGAVVSAFFASLCCIGPLAFALLGIGGAGLLVQFEALRPYLTAATLALLGTGFYFTYRSPKPIQRAAGADCACELPRINRFGRVTLWLATGLVLALLALPYLAPLVLD